MEWEHETFGKGNEVLQEVPLEC